MAFQTGTRVDPRLGALDFSGFTNAANTQAQALANLGATIGGVIEAKKEKKEEKRLNKNAAALVFKLSESEPEIGKQLGIETLEDAMTAVETLGGYKPTMSLLMEIGANNAMFEPEVITLGEGDDAVRAIRTSRGQVQLLQEKGEPESLPANVRSYEYFYDLGIKRGLSEEDADKDARALVFGDGKSSLDILSKFLTGDGVVTNNKTGTGSETKTNLNRDPRRRPKNKLNDPLKIENNLSKEERERLKELREKAGLGKGQ